MSCSSKERKVELDLEKQRYTIGTIICEAKGKIMTDNPEFEEELLNTEALIHRLHHSNEEKFLEKSTGEKLRKIIKYVFWDCGVMNSDAWNFTSGKVKLALDGKYKKKETSLSLGEKKLVEFGEKHREFLEAFLDINNDSGVDSYDDKDKNENENEDAAPIYLPVSDHQNADQLHENREHECVYDSSDLDYDELDPTQQYVNQLQDDGKGADNEVVKTSDPQDLHAGSNESGYDQLTHSRPYQAADNSSDSSRGDAPAGAEGGGANRLNSSKTGKKKKDTK